MIGLSLCVIAFVATFTAAGRSLGHGFVSLLAFGYVYGILRSNVADVGAHFIFDAALFGLYAASFSGVLPEALRIRSQSSKNWTLVLAAWPFVCMAYSPLLPDSQPMLVQLVGLRSAILMLPCMILGARLKRSDLGVIAPGLAILNLFALGVGMLEYVYGIEAFIPHSAVSDLIYVSKDIEGATSNFYRIPSTFIASHAYGGTMVLSVPFIVHGLESGGRVRLLCWAGIGAAVLGIFLCGARLPVVMLGLATAFVLLSMRARASTLFAFAATAGAIGYLVAGLERFQRFTTLGDTELVRSRFQMSMNMSFFDVLQAYPVGAGLASAAGTSIPYFLTQTPGIHDAIGLENEYARILLEQGIVGLLLWVAFVVFSVLRRQKMHEASPTSASYMQATIAITWAVGCIGTGSLTSVPTTPIFLAAVGMRLASPALARATARKQAPRGQSLRGAPAVRTLAVHRTSR